MKFERSVRTSLVEYFLDFMREKVLHLLCALRVVRIDVALSKVNVSEDILSDRSQSDLLVPEHLLPHSHQIAVLVALLLLRKRRGDCGARLQHKESLALVELCI